MKQVLVYGLKDPVGGVEKVVLDYVRHMAGKGDICFHFVQFEDKFSLEDMLNELGCRVFYLPARRSDYTGYQEGIRRVFEQNTYAAVWANLSGLTNIDALILAKKHGVPVRVAHSHVSRLYWGNPIMKYVVHFLHRYNKMRLPQYATHYWACSTEAGEFMYPAGVYGKIQVINNAISAGEFYPDRLLGDQMRRNLGFAPDIPVIGHVARMCEAKNQIFLLEVMSRILTLRPDARMLFVGSGELEQQIKDTAMKLQIADQIVFAGNCSNVADYYRAMDVFVLPSVAEGFGRCVVEAQACGVPCVVSDRVPRTVDISGAVQFLPLEQKVSVWADEILRQIGTPVEDPVSRLSACGYEISSQAEKLREVFLGD